MNGISYRIPILTLLIYLILSGCITSQKPSMQVKPEYSNFDKKIDGLIQSLKNQFENSPYSLYPAYVTTESLIRDNHYSSFEEHIINKIKSRVIRKYYPLNRQNWFALRENNPLAMREDFVIFILHKSYISELNRIDVHVSLKGKDGKEIYQNMGSMTLNCISDSPACVMNGEASIPAIPFGLPENPYGDLEKFAYGLTNELVERYGSTSIYDDDDRVADDEIRVYIDVEADEGRVSDLIGRAVRDRLLERGAFNSTFQRKDFKKFLERLAHYQKHGSRKSGIFDVSEFRELRVEPASIYLTIDISRIDCNYRVSLRAFWMSNPMETASGDIIRINSAGLYIAPFFALAYLDRNAIGEDCARVSEEKDNNSIISLDQVPESRDSVRVQINDKSLYITDMKILAPFDETPVGIVFRNDRIIEKEDSLQYAYAIEVTSNKPCQLLLVNVDTKEFGYRLLPTPCKTGIDFNPIIKPSVPKRYPGGENGIYYIGLDNVTGMEDIYAIVYSDPKIKEKVWVMVLNEICNSSGSHNSIRIPKGSLELPGVSGVRKKRKTHRFEAALMALGKQYEGEMSWVKRSFWHR